MAGKGNTHPKAVAYTDTYEGKPAVFVTGFIHEGFGLYLADYLAEQAKRAGQQITMFLQSPGGIVTEAFAFFDFVRVHGIDFRVEGYGQVDSASTVIAAAAGRERIALAENAAVLVHRAYFVNEWGERVNGNAEELARINAQLVKVYTDLTGMDAAAVEALMDKGDEGTSMSAADAVAQGFAGSVIAAARAAAFNRPQAIAGTTTTTDHTPNMSKPTTTVPVKLAFAAALASLVGKEVEATIDVDAAVAAQLAEKDTTIDALRQQIATLEEAAKNTPPPTEAPAAEVEELRTQLEAAQAEANTKAQALAAKETELAAVNTKLTEALAKPLAGPVVGDNANGAVAAMPNTAPEEPGRGLVRGFFQNMTELEKAEYNRRLKAQQEAKAAATQPATAKA